MERSPAEWAVLGLIAEAATHGFALARELGRDGSVGQVWTIPRPLVYRAINTLESDGLVETVAVEPGDSAPPRQIVRITRRGRSELRRWLHEPVAHVRDLRGPLLLKLVLLDRSGGDAVPLLEAQVQLLDSQVRGFRRQARSADGFDRTLIDWRVENATAAKRFVNRELVRIGSAS